MELSLNGAKASSPRIVVEEGKMGTITQETNGQKSYFEVVATESEIQGNKGILLKFKVGYIKKDGTRTIVSKPTILTKAGEEASISVGNENGKEELHLKVVANRKTL